MSSTVHMIVGSITLLLFLVNAVMYGIEFVKGRPAGYHRIVSFGAATALFLQYALGFMLLGSGDSIKWTHYVLALVAIAPVGVEHAFSQRPYSFRRKSMIGMAASAATFVLVLAAYAIGEMN